MPIDLNIDGPILPESRYFWMCEINSMRIRCEKKVNRSVHYSNNQLGETVFVVEKRIQVRISIDFDSKPKCVRTFFYVKHTSLVLFRFISPQRKDFPL